MGVSKLELACSWQQAERFAWEAENAHSGAQLADFVLTMPADTQVVEIERALAETARAHDMLRASFTQDEKGTHHLAVDHDLSVRLTDVGTCSSFEALRELADRSLHRSKPPLWTATVARIDDQRCVHIVIEHLVFDGMSLRIFLRSFAAALDGATIRPAPGYVDYCAWQEARRHSAEWEEDLAFWRGFLGASATPLELRTSFSNPARTPAADAADVRSWAYPKSVDGAFGALAAAHELTPFKSMLCVMAATWGRELGVREVHVMVPRAGRPRQFIRTIGWFASVLPFVVRWESDTTMEELFKQVRTDDLRVEQHQHLPPSLLDGLAPGSAGRGVLAFLVDFPDTPLSIPRSQVELHDAMVSGEHEHLDFKLVNSPDRVRLECHFNRRVHDEGDVERVLDNLWQNLEQAGEGRLPLP